MTEMNEHNEHEMVGETIQSPLKETVASLSRTPKGRIVYDRDPLVPIDHTTFNSKSGVLLSDDIFHRNPLDLSDKSVKSFPQSTLNHPATLGSKERPSLYIPLQHPEKTINEFKWQHELLFMRNTNQLEETTPVYNLSNHMIMQLYEFHEEKRMLSKASGIMKHLEGFEDSRQKAAEECLSKKRELEERLVPKTEDHIDVEMNIRRLQDEARLRRQKEEDSMDRKLQYIQEKAQQEDLRKKTLELHTNEAKRRKRACSEKLDSLFRSLQGFVGSCLEKEVFLQTIKAKLDRTTALKTQFEIVVNDENCDDPLVSTVRSENIVKQIEDLVQVIQEDISKNNADVQERISSTKRRSESVPPAPVTSIASVKDSKPTEPPTPENKSNEPESETAEDDDDFAHQDDNKMYVELMAELNQYEAKVNAFSSNPSLKSLRFDLLKAVIHPLNEIADHSGQHLQDKLDRLRNLLQGKAVSVGAKIISATEHPGGLEFCTYILARQLVEQGDKQVNVIAKAAFPLAAVISELWLEFPFFGRLVLAHFYRQCPYLVPLYLPQKEGQSDEEFYKSLGYKYSGGKVEQQPAYLKRMCGVVRLYAAVTITLPRRNQPHPHGLQQAWRYLASLLNLAPRNAITALILVEFLTVAGHSMKKEYGKQFQKMLHLICTDYFAMIHNVSPEGGGPVNRLQEFLHESISKGGIAPPAGQLPPNFW